MLSRFASPLQSKRSRRFGAGLAVAFALATFSVAFATHFEESKDPAPTSKVVTQESKVLTPESGDVVWKQIPDPSNRVKFLPSLVKGGTAMAIPAGGKGERTATWTATGLKRGYWRLEILYYQHPSNAKGLKIYFKRTTEKDFVRFGTQILNQTSEAKWGVTVGPTIGKTGYVAVTKDLTLNTTRTGTGSEFWIETTNKTQDNGSLSIRISDDGCNEGQMIADTIRLTLVSDVKVSDTISVPWRK